MKITLFFILFFNISAKACVVTLLNGEPKTIEIVRMELGIYKNKEIRAYFSVVLDGVLQMRDLFLKQSDEGNWSVQLTRFEEHFEMSFSAKERLKNEAVKMRNDLLAQGKLFFKMKSPEPENKKIDVFILQNEQVNNLTDKNHKANLKLLFSNYLAVSGIKLYEGSKGSFLSYPGEAAFYKGKSQYYFFPLYRATLDCLLNAQYK